MYRQDPSRGTFYTLQRFGNSGGLLGLHILTWTPFNKYQKITTLWDHLKRELARNNDDIWRQHYTEKKDGFPSEPVWRQGQRTDRPNCSRPLSCRYIYYIKKKCILLHNCSRQNALIHFLQDAISWLQFCFYSCNTVACVMHSLTDKSQAFKNYHMISTYGFFFLFVLFVTTLLFSPSLT